MSHSVKGSDLNIPFPCFYLTVPEDIVTVSFAGDEGECLYEGVSQGVYVIEVERKGNIYWDIVASLKVRNYKNKTQTGSVMVAVNLPAGEHIDIFESAKKVLINFPLY